MGALIDSSVLIAAERGTLDLDAVLKDYGNVDFAVSAITASEIIHGVHRTKSAERRTRREAYVEALLSRFPVLPFDLIAARAHSRLWAQLAAKGVAIGAHDLLIAATAIAKGLDLVTCDERGFSRIPGLSLIRW